MLYALLKTFKATLRTRLSHFSPKISILPNEQAVPNDCLLHFGADWIKEHTQYLNRNIKYAQNRSHSKKWDIVISKNKINIRSSGFCSLQSKVGVFCDTFIECGG